MRRRPFTALLAAGVAITAFLAAGPTGAAEPAPSGAPAPTYELSVPVRSNAAADAALLEGKGFDVMEGSSADGLRVLGGETERERLTALGFRSTVKRELPAVQWDVPDAADSTYYGGYLTVNGQYAHMEQVARQKPGLAKVVDYGKSWRKLKGKGGHELKAICITHITSEKDCSLDPKAPKPRYVVVGQVHAREIATGEIARRWIDQLVDSYGDDAAVTSLMNSTEFWVIPVANPDGVDIVQEGGDAPYLQRKNANTDNGTTCANPPTGNSQSGVDLNRNAGFKWNSGGSSGDPCSPAYRGPAADSEPENTALEGLFRKLYPDTRGPEVTDAASPSTRGIFISLHSDIRMVLFPWAWTTDDGPNDASLRAIAAGFAKDTGYTYGQPGELLYAASGGTDDWAYGELGVPSLTVEVGSTTNSACNGFLPAYSCISESYWPTLSKALLNTAKAAKAPYTVS
ncbi:carboxypeptidase (plasmid) [Streptomyces lunaelactis]|uniref:Zinc carboxypeptidase n=1 Tax=Streptomyces lunaelactis TaxID=1535768 RepID=A0A2R4TFP3_9ACTN|nr:M14 family zinc carboxypeptidase [Streptomyces lunaelactis]AVZ77929.1 carboxypeptidase [Streptomyces lunaelactis]NUK83410.1 carboxypeptidase [Streptomyces lunaelactis]